ncbi:MAG: type 4a pilus biogenesis protein PilO [Magnetococcales bacterium]|nr:type 4a pilus biogenesis protein PilO [Magnetococcales bacterium]MBF0151352.1 type 4a pilus biogenesis protein PilO [Magnetococcales bacterium]MBF0172985.1 type 4a pilus biogenesis protein PilO [Magnetococcales bacterium]MBF0348277.1 type 4a pilus biogenesis protein PilO [Magnetococcales bacterium]MBF0631950.1 type 4a pilus biogenesis protein PilO [Magnetococcales bacterium]
MELGFDPIEILRLPAKKKGAILAVIIVVLSAGYWYFFLQEVLDKIDATNAKLVEQQEKIDNKRAMLASLPKLRKELEELKKMEEKASRNLPSKQEIPALLTDISQAGHEQGLEFILFAPKQELSVEIHAEVPVDVHVQGSFQATVTFMDHVTRMSRIATFTNLTMTPIPNRDGLVKTTTRLTTYRFLDTNDAGFKSPSDKK